MVMKISYLSILLSLNLLASGSSGATENTATVTIFNKSDSDIRFLDVGIAGKTLRINNMKNGAVTKVQFRGLGDSHYLLEGELQDGTKIGGEFGYVTNGMNFNDTFVITKGGKIEFTSQSH
jgi:hypothetical protein